MSGPWKLLTLLDGTPILVNTVLYETVRVSPAGTWLFPKHSTPNVYLAVKEPFELVCAMLTEQPDEPAREQSP